MTDLLTPEAAAAALDIAQNTARLVRRGVVVTLPKRRRLRVTWAPDQSYGRYHAPPAGNEALEYVYSVWSPATAREDAGTHIAQEHRGWRPVHDGDAGALALLQGAEPDTTLSEGRELAARFGGKS